MRGRTDHRATRIEIAREHRREIDAQRIRCDPGPARALISELATVSLPQRVLRAMARLIRQLDE